MSDNNTKPRNVVEIVSDNLDADIYLLSGEIDREIANDLIDLYKKSHRRTNCVLVLSTFGGLPDGAFIIARFLRRKYEKLILFVFGYCKSAGTLVALGANEIVMSEHGELGPLDVQLFREDEFGRYSSGLDIFQALNILHAQAYKVWETNFLKLKARSGGSITTKTAADIASSLAVQLLLPISAQVDPLRLGEMQRAINIAQHYGERLGAKADTISRLISDYPSHGFVIDYEEAKDLFPNVRQPSDVEYAFERILRKECKHQLGEESIRSPHSQGFLACLTRIAREEELDDEHITEEPDDTNESGGVSNGSSDGGTIQASGDNSQPSEQGSDITLSRETNGRRKNYRAETTSE